MSLSKKQWTIFFLVGILIVMPAITAYIWSGFAIVLS